MTNGYDLLAGMVINRDTGALAPVSWQPIKISADGPWGPDGIAIDPAGRFLYVADSSMVAISGFEISSKDGSLEEVPGSPLKLGPLGSCPQVLQIDPTGKFLYMPLRCPYWSTGCATNALHGLSIDAEDGHLLEMGSSPWQTPFTDLVSLAMDAGGRFLFIVDGGGANVQTAKGTHGFAVDPMTGQPTLLTNGFPFQPAAITFLNADPTGAFLYGGNISADQIETYAIHPATGALMKKQALKFTPGGAPWSIAVTQMLQ
jgi:6-phosphogluconolactonase (cycloisomerase 2 family)